MGSGTIRAALAAVMLTASMTHAVLAQHQPLVKPGACAQGYLPVCAVNKKTLVTYVNSCIARSVNARVIAAHRGCFEGCPSGYAPVCGTDSAGNLHLYGNLCEAENSGAKDIRSGRCPTLRRVTSPGAAVGTVP